MAPKGASRVELPNGGANLGAMLARPIPSSGEMLPVVGCGTWQTFDTAGSAVAGPAEVLGRLFKGGGSVIDSSPMYGRAEQTVGQALTRLSPETPPFLATKVWTHGRRAGIEQMERSFRLLGASVIDLLQVHNLVDWETHLPILREWKAAGRLRYLGVTHYAADAHSALEAAIGTRAFDFVQFNYSLLDRAAEDRLLPAARDLGVAVIINRPFGEGGLIRRLRGRPLPAIAAELGCATWPELALKFVVSHPVVTCAIPATADPDHMTANCRAGNTPAATAEQRDKILAAVNG